MATMTPAEFADKWGRRLKAATEDMRTGAARVAEAPSKAAVAKQAKMKERLVAAIDDGTWAKQLSKYTLEQWNKDFSDVGVSRISSGVDKAGDKMTAFGNYLMPTVSAGQKAIQAMPDVTIDDSIARAASFMKYMAKNKYKTK